MRRIKPTDYSKIVEEEATDVSPEDQPSAEPRYPAPQVRKQKVNWGRWRVEQERSQIETSARPPPAGNFSEIGAVIPSIMKRLTIAQDYWQERMQNDWCELVKPPISRNCRPGPLDGVSLTVYFTNSTWLREFKVAIYKPLLEKLQKKYGAEKIRHMKLLIDPDVGRHNR